MSVFFSSCLPPSRPYIPRTTLCYLTILKGCTASLARVEILSLALQAFPIPFFACRRDPKAPFTPTNPHPLTRINVLVHTPLAVLTYATTTGVLLSLSLSLSIDTCTDCQFYDVRSSNLVVKSISFHQRSQSSTAYRSKTAAVALVFISAT